MLVKPTPMSVEMSLLGGVIETSPVASMWMGSDISEERIESGATVGGRHLD